ncbi:MAG: ABC transporter ATP-binding protein [Betaproteobacteria bacterium]|nr:ABC transporter ATP-binding protein [Betaproteobacteria bacterium]MBU6511261.1 ABC transporter ATP-binding protein [Betaproteobacteria bacterium]MDE1957321.1 ABC transporter ATP-binding protein [Betaproteobacteria bacterium]MDE2151049.1 ABC transporter ATP-binding protein [Betaproteobacteria bacterium]
MSTTHSPVQELATAGAAETGAQAALDIRGLHAWYGESHVLHGVDLQVPVGQTVCLLGRNGAGRSSTLRAVMGLTSARSGSIRVFGQDLARVAPHRVAGLGVGYCPEERGIFASLSTRENLLLPPLLRTGFEGLSLQEIDTLFPNLKERARSPGSRLSGGEQQMLALARILRTGARLLLLDEISEGLAPVIVQALGRAIASLRDRGFSILLVEQNFHFSARLADSFYVMERGRIVEHFSREQLPGKRERLEQLLGV